MNEYEAERQRRIEKNKAQLAALGLARTNGSSAPLGGVNLAGWSAPLPGSEQTAPQPPRLPRRRAHAEAPQAVEATRASSRKRKKSRRLRGSDDESLSSDEDGSAENTVPAPAEHAAEAAQTSPAAVAPPAATLRTRTHVLEPCDTSVVVAPFTLRSIGVTIWDIGAIQRDSFAPRFWSSKGCLFHHAYPVGFRAQKQHFGRSFTMHILAGPCGPVFRVVDDTSGEVFDGESPTRPWTGVCQSRRLGTRISGPLFFGFSDPMTQRAIARLYTPTELEAARSGSTVASLAPSPEESAAAEFRALDGLGEASSLALAHTRSLLPDGQRVRSLQQLQQVARGDGGAALSQFLLHSLEVPDSVRRWPLWTVFVPKIIAALLSDDPGRRHTQPGDEQAQEPAPAQAEGRPHESAPIQAEGGRPHTPPYTPPSISAQPLPQEAQ